MDERLQIFQDKMEKSLANLNEEFAGIRAGRANPHVLDKLRVDYSDSERCKCQCSGAENDSDSAMGSIYGKRN